MSKSNGKTSKKFSNEYTQKLSDYRNALMDMDKRLVICAGLPSTGKTAQAIDCAVALVKKEQFEKLIIVRPTVPLSCGLLPGSLLEKMNPYINQSNKYCDELGNTPLYTLIQQERAEVLPTDALQGNRFANCIVIFDEMQNVSHKETFTILSRLGEGSKFVLLGDISTGQLLNKKVKKGETILDYCIDKFENESYCSVHRFYDKDDILGDKVTKKIIIKLLEDFVEL